MKVCMAKRHRGATPKSIQKRIDEGRGDGYGVDYKPWLTIQDVSSIGLVHRIKGSKHGRVHHLMSNLERDYFYLLEWSEKVTDIREQYPLLPIEETIRLADNCGLRHPYDPFTRHPIVMTTDFVVTLKSGGTTRMIARTAKYSDQLSRRRVLEKFEIERRYWVEKDIDWAIITERDINQILVRNIELFLSYRQIDDRGLSPSQISLATSALNSNLIGTHLSIAQLAAQCDMELELPIGSSLTVAYHLIATKVWLIDLSQTFNPQRPLVLRLDV
jgi:hypothetical protein